ISMPVDPRDTVSRPWMRLALRERATDESVPCRSGVRPMRGPEVETSLAINETAPTHLPQIIISGKQLRDMTTESLMALRRANTPPMMFVRAGELVRVIADEN